jgi:hypothetical protein
LRAARSYQLEKEKKPDEIGLFQLVEMRRLELLTPYMRSIKWGLSDLNDKARNHEEISAVSGFFVCDLIPQLSVGFRTFPAVWPT